MSANPTIPAPLLLVRRNMLRDEWIPEFVRYLAHSNGFSSPSPGDLPDIERTVTACAAPDDRSYRHLRRQPLTATALTQPFPHLILPKSTALQAHDLSRVCPVCMLEKSYVRRLWRIRSFDICTRHGCFLVDLDDHLGQRLDDACNKAGGDREKFAWLLQSTCFKPCSALEMDSHCNLWQGVEFHEEHEPGFQEGLGWALLITDALQRMREPPRGQFEDSPAGRSIRRAMWFRRAMALSLLGSAQGVRELIDRSSHSSDLKAIERTLQMATDARERGATVFDGLPLGELQDYLYRTRPQTRDRTSSARIQPTRTSTTADLARLEAMRLLDVPSYQFDEWVQKGAIKATPWSQVLTVKAPQFDRGQVTAVKRFLTHLTPLNHFCEEFLIAPGVVRALSLEGCLTTMVVERTLKVDCRSAWHLLDALQCLSRPLLETGAPTRALFSTAASETPQNQARPLDELMDVLAGKRLLFRDLRASGFSSFRVHVPNPAINAVERTPAHSAAGHR